MLHISALPIVACMQCIRAPPTLVCRPIIRLASAEWRSYTSLPFFKDKSRVCALRDIDPWVALGTVSMSHYIIITYDNVTFNDVTTRTWWFDFARDRLLLVHSKIVNNAFWLPWAVDKQVLQVMNILWKMCSAKSLTSVFPVHALRDQ